MDAPQQLPAVGAVELLSGAAKRVARAPDGEAGVDFLGVLRRAGENGRTRGWGCLKTDCAQGVERFLDRASLGNLLRIGDHAVELGEHPWCDAEARGLGLDNGHPRGVVGDAGASDGS